MHGIASSISAGRCAAMVSKSVMIDAPHPSDRARPRKSLAAPGRPRRRQRRDNSGGPGAAMTVMLACMSGGSSPVRGVVRIGLHEGSRQSLRPLFELAEDSAAQLDSYL